MVYWDRCIILGSVKITTWVAGASPRPGIKKSDDFVLALPRGYGGCGRHPFSGEARLLSVSTDFTPSFQNASVSAPIPHLPLVWARTMKKERKYDRWAAIGSIKPLEMEEVGKRPLPFPQSFSKVIFSADLTRVTCFAWILLNPSQLLRFYHLANQGLSSLPFSNCLTRIQNELGVRARELPDTDTQTTGKDHAAPTRLASLPRLIEPRFS